MKHIIQNITIVKKWKFLVHEKNWLFFWYKNSNIIKKIDFMKKNIFSINHFGSKRAIRINVKI